MQSYTGATFNSGPVARILDLAISVQESRGKFSLDDELKRFTRIVSEPGAAHWICPVSTAAALIEFVADSLGDGVLRDSPVEFQEKLHRASEGMDSGEYLRTLAGMLRLLARDLPPSYRELPMAAWELSVTFPRLAGFGGNWVEEGEYETLGESVRAAIESEHPYCSEFLPSLAAEAQAALVLFPEPTTLTANVGQRITWVSVASLRELLQGINGHMSQEHGVAT